MVEAAELALAEWTPGLRVAKLISASSGIFPTTRRSFRLDVGRFDQRPPFLDLRFLERAECLRALLIQRGNLLT
jgi:hypothetical protein